MRDVIFIDTISGFSLVIVVYFRENPFLGVVAAGFGAGQLPGYFAFPVGAFPGHAVVVDLALDCYQVYPVFVPWGCFPGCRVVAGDRYFPVFGNQCLFGDLVVAIFLCRAVYVWCVPAI